MKKGRNKIVGSKGLFLLTFSLVISVLVSTVMTAPTSVSTFESISLYWSPNASDITCDTPATVYDPADFDHVIEDLEYTSTLKLDSHDVFEFFFSHFSTCKFYYQIE